MTDTTPSSEAVAVAAWLGAPRMGAPCTGFIPLKAPMDFAVAFESATEQPPEEECEFTVTQFMERQASDSRAVGLCIDLTTPQPDGRQLYDTDEWKRDWDVEYVRLPCAPPVQFKDVEAASSEPVPEEAVVNRFIAVVSRFWANPANHRRHVAVHCVTGVNVAGYMIARFLMRNAPVGKTLNALAKCRPPGIYSPDLLEAAWRAGSASASANSKRPAAADGGWVQPSPPSWHPLSFRAVDRSAAVPTMPPPQQAKRAMPPDALLPPPPAKRLASPSHATSGASSTVTGTNDVGADALGHIGTRLPSSEAAQLWRKCELLALGVKPEDGKNDDTMSQLPCYSHGEPLMATHLEAMAAGGSDAWLVTWKPTGVRCMLLVQADDEATNARSVLLDCRGAAYQLAQMQWPKSGGGGRCHSGLVLAGEIVSDREKVGDPPIQRLLCYDILALDGKSTATLPLSKRLALLGKEVLEPRRMVAAGPRTSDGATASADTAAMAAAAVAMRGELLRVRQKDCFRLSHAAYLLRKFLPKLSHPVKGLVFLRSDTPFAAHNPGNVLDWRRLTTPAGNGAMSEAELLSFADARFTKA